MQQAILGAEISARQGMAVRDGLGHGPRLRGRGAPSDEEVEIRLCRGPEVGSVDARRGAALALLCATALTRPPGGGPGCRPLAPDATVSLRHPAQPLSQALNQLALQSNREILFSPALTAGRRSRALKGVFTPEEALARLLAGSGLTVRLEGRSFLIVPRHAGRALPRRSRQRRRPPRSRPLDSVVVTALKRSTLIQKTPISMTVVTGEQLSRLGVVDLERAAPLLPGPEAGLHRLWSAAGAARRLRRRRSDDGPLLR
jgi:iron complex outermembrane receptor protein